MALYCLPYQHDQLKLVTPGKYECNSRTWLLLLQIIMAKVSLNISEKWRILIHRSIEPHTTGLHAF